MSNELTVQSGASTAVVDAFTNMSAFENGQRICKMLSQSRLIPQSYQNNLPDCMVALEMANRTNTSPLIVMQNLNVIHGRPSWSAKYVAAALTASKVDSLSYQIVQNGTVEIDGKSVPNLECRAVVIDRRSKAEVVGPTVSIKMAVAEGWIRNSKWLTMPELMLRYRAVTFLANTSYPDVLLGINVESDDAPISSSDVNVAREKKSPPKSSRRCPKNPFRLPRPLPNPNRKRSAPVKKNKPRRPFISFPILLPNLHPSLSKNLRRIPLRFPSSIPNRKIKSLRLSLILNPAIGTSGASNHGNARKHGDGLL